MRRLRLSTEAGVTAPCSGFGVLGTDGWELGSPRDAPTAENQQPGRELQHGSPGKLCCGGMRKGKKFFPPSQG